MSSSCIGIKIDFETLVSIYFTAYNAKNNILSLKILFVSYNYDNLIKIENNNLYSNDIEYSMVTKNQIIDLVYLFCVQKYNDIDSLEDLNHTYILIDKILKKYTFEQIINFDYTKYNSIYNQESFRTSFWNIIGYSNRKERYEKYFKIKLNITNKDYMYALPLGFMPLQKVFINYSNINKLKPNFLDINVYNALLIFNADELIWQDKLEKGIVVRKEYKNKFSEVYKID